MSRRVLQHLVCVHLISRDIASFVALANRIVNFVAVENVRIYIYINIYIFFFFEWLRGKYFVMNGFYFQIQYLCVTDSVV